MWIQALCPPGLKGADLQTANSEIPDYAGGIIAFGGIDKKGEVSVRRVSRVATAYRHAFGKRLTIDTDVVASANQLAHVILDLHEKAALGPPFDLDAAAKDHDDRFKLLNEYV